MGNSQSLHHTHFCKRKSVRESRHQHHAYEKLQTALASRITITISLPTFSGPVQRWTQSASSMSNFTLAVEPCQHCSPQPAKEIQVTIGTPILKDTLFQFIASLFFLLRRLEGCADTASKYMEVEAQSPWGRDLLLFSKQNENVNSEKSCCFVACTDTLPEMKKSVLVKD